MTDTIHLIMDIILALFAFFGVAPMILNTVAQFGVHKRFAKTMVEEGVVSADTVKMLLPKKQIASVLISALVLGVLAVVSYRNAPYGYFCAGIPLLVGFAKYRFIVQFTSMTVQRFQATYRDQYDTAKLNKYVSEHF